MAAVRKQNIKKTNGTEISPLKRAFQARRLAALKICIPESFYK